MHQETSRLKADSASLMLQWSRCLLPHYGKSGALELNPHSDLFALYGPSLTHQHAHYALLLLSEGIVPGATPQEARQFRQAALRNLRYLTTIIDQDYKAPFAGQMVYNGWLIYFLMQSNEIIQERALGDAALRRQLNQLVHGYLEVYWPYIREANEPNWTNPPAHYAGNLAVWHGAVISAAGQKFQRREWIDFAHRYFRTMSLPYQGAHGTWEEGGGMLYQYGMVSAQALSIHAEAANDEEARVAVGRSLGFFQFLTFPDQSSSAVADPRNQYLAINHAVGFPPSYLHFRGGPEFCLALIQRMLAKVEAFDPNKLAHFAVFVAAAHADPNPAAWGRREPPPVRIDKVAKVSDANWTCFLSTQITPEQDQVYHLDLQNFIDVWNRDARLLIGGGQSKYMPRFSTLRRTSGTRGYVPSAASLLERTDRRIVAAYEFDHDKLLARVELVGPEVHIGFKVVQRGPHKETYEAGVILYMNPNEELRITPGIRWSLDPRRSYEHRFAAPGQSFEFRGRTFQPPPDAWLWYNMHYWNYYLLDMLSSDVRGRLSWPVTETESVLVIR